METIRRPLMHEPALLRRSLIRMQPLDLEAELRRHHTAAFGWAVSCCAGVTADAEDALQNAYVRILAGRARFDGRSTFRTWLFGVIRRAAQELVRSERRRSAHARQETVDQDEVSSHERLEQTQEINRLVSALQQLSERQREVLHLVFYQEMTIEEAAQVMGITVGSARTHYERGKQRLRSHLADRVRP